MYRITVLPVGCTVEVPEGETLLSALIKAGLPVDAPCGGNGSCGKCKVWVEGEPMLACRSVVCRDMTVTLDAPQSGGLLTRGVAVSGGENRGFCLAFDIGTTTVVGYLLAPGGKELAHQSAMNPQIAFGSDVISRVRHALAGEMELLTDGIRRCVDKIARALCQEAGIFPEEIETVSLVGNPAMQQLFLGIAPENLAQPPYAPVLTRGERVAASAYLPRFSKAELLIVPNISGFVGADTLACVLATGMDEQEGLSLLVDIGTNGEMVLGNRERMVACSTAAGPALEGAGIQWGMRAMEGAIDHVWRQGEGFGCSVIGGGEPAGLCGSGLIDAVAAALDAGLLNRRGRIENESRTIPVSDPVVLTQEDIRRFQQAKGAIAAGIRLMAEHLGVSLGEIQRVYLAGAFGSFLNPEAACRTGLLPGVLADKIQPVGNAAGSGAKLIACARDALLRAERLAGEIGHLQLASVPEFGRCFAEGMYFQTPEEYWCAVAKQLGFSQAVPLLVHTLQPRQDIRAMCAENKCGAYGKNWCCPPHCGTLEECSEALKDFSRGILLQTVGTTEKLIDTKAYRRIEQSHLERFYRFCGLLRRWHPQALCLGSGGCRVCPECAFPEPCPFPEKACASMEAYGLFVTQVCRDHDLAYHYGERTVTYTACVLF